MQKKKNQLKFPSELRYDLISKNWVIIATGRAKRPENFKTKGKKDKEILPKDCPFCNLESQEKPVLIFNKGKKILTNKIPKEWTTVSIPNKYPAFIPFPKLEKRKEGEFYQKMNAAGFHEVVVTRDHKKTLAQFTIQEVKELIDVYHQRYLDLMNKTFVNHIAIFHNYGEKAGASITHPHSQIITTPLIDVDLNKALETSKNYYKKSGKCIYCELNKWDMKVKKRKVFENNKFIVVCPFASKLAFQIIISPKKHLPYFEKISEDEKWSLAEAFQTVFKKLYKGLSNPAYNFYLHTSPCDGKEYPYYHWHWTILPRTSSLAGFELGMGMEISTIEPEKAAQYLRKL